MILLAFVFFADPNFFFHFIAGCFGHFFSGTNCGVFFARVWRRLQTVQVL